jgi:hypothetical protein
MVVKVIENAKVTSEMILHILALAKGLSIGTKTYSNVLITIMNNSPVYTVLRTVTKPISTVLLEFNRFY